jgi:putative salt-induced outer membrane protein
MNSLKIFGPFLAVVFLLTASPAAALTSSAPSALPANRTVPAPILALLEVAAAERDGADFVEIAVLAAKAQPAHAMAIFAAARRLEPGADAALIKAAARFSNAAGAGNATAQAAAPGGRAPRDGASFLDLGAWDGGLELGLSVSSGNTREQAYALGLDLKRVISSRWDHKFEFDMDYARRLAVTSKERYAGHYELFYRRWERAYLYSFLAAERDRFSAFAYRVTESVGAGYQIFDGPRQKWSLEGGPGLRQTKLNTIMPDAAPAIGGDFGNEFIAVLNSEYELRLTEGLSFSDKTRLFVGQERTTLVNEAALKARLNNSLSARLSFDLKYDSQVLAGTRKTDKLTRATIVYDF